MKSFKSYVKENLVGTSNERGIDADTGMSAGDVTNADTLRKLNAFIGTLGNMEYLLPEHALNRLRTQLMKVGLSFVKEGSIEPISCSFTIHIPILFTCI